MKTITEKQREALEKMKESGGPILIPSVTGRVLVNAGLAVTDGAGQRGKMSVKITQSGIDQLENRLSA